MRTRAAGTTTTNVDARTAAEVDKLRADAELTRANAAKAAAETDELKRPFLSRGSFWTLVIPIITGAVTIYFLITSNILGLQGQLRDAESKLYELQKTSNTTLLKEANDKLKAAEDERVHQQQISDDTKASIAAEQTSLRDLRTAAADAKTKLDDANKQLDDTKAQLDDTNRRIVFGPFNSAIQRLTTTGKDARWGTNEDQLVDLVRNLPALRPRLESIVNDAGALLMRAKEIEVLVLSTDDGSLYASASAGAGSDNTPAAASATAMWESALLNLGRTAAAQGVTDSTFWDLFVQPHDSGNALNRDRSCDFLLDTAIKLMRSRADDLVFSALRTALNGCTPDYQDSFQAFNLLQPFNLGQLTGFGNGLAVYSVAANPRVGFLIDVAGQMLGDGSVHDPYFASELADVVAADNEFAGLLLFAKTLADNGYPPSWVVAAEQIAHAAGRKTAHSGILMAPLGIAPALQAEADALASADLSAPFEPWRIFLAKHAGELGAVATARHGAWPRL